MEKGQQDDVDRVNELTSDLEDLKTSVEELQIDPLTKIDRKSLEAVKGALQQATDATDEIEDQQEEIRRRRMKTETHRFMTERRHHNRNYPYMPKSVISQRAGR